MPQRVTCQSVAVGGEAVRQQQHLQQQKQQQQLLRPSWFGCLIERRGDRPEACRDSVWHALSNFSYVFVPLRFTPHFASPHVPDILELTERY
mmetsp:Transcript_49345/g.158785  ORF Transcript_49345/g.158785 Transcript_49345/m.158785 type:complete len:92 (+) Transcript_49345:4107-4382(+)